MVENVKEVKSSSLTETILQATSIDIDRCYQCGKCSAGCPAATAMDLKPSVLLRLLQTKNEKNDLKVLQSYTIWLCLSCHTCVTRCPMDIDLPTIMDVLRRESLQKKLVNPKAKDIVAFHSSFLNTVKRLGRMWEVGMVVEYKLRTGHFWQDVMLAPSMVLKGKLSLLPPKRISRRKLFSAKKQKEAA
ncbi:MAG TPA: 4Fe-4S dicluster domain-containing protein [Bacteroidota bacterium]|nr:4Fe-4S dicluster domain-containing protein [Bacteroidota bacterium]